MLNIQDFWLFLLGLWYFPYIITPKINKGWSSIFHKVSLVTYWQGGESLYLTTWLLLYGSRCNVENDMQMNKITI